MSMNNLSGNIIIWQVSQRLTVADHFGDAKVPLEVPALMKVNPSVGDESEVKVVLADDTEQVIQAWECREANMMVKKIFSTDAGILATDIRLYK